MKLTRIKTRKGQAAITDALFFLVIIVTLSVLMFRYSSTYGSRIEKASSDLYYKEYTNSVLKTIFYVSVPLDFDLNLEKTKQNDYLMALVKQDYYAHGKLGFSDMNDLDADNYLDIAKYNLFHTIKATMRPLESQDYLFYLYRNKEPEGFVYFTIKNTRFKIPSNNQQSPTDKQGKVDKVRGVKNYELENNPYHYYLCAPESYEDVRSVVSKSSKIFSSSIPLAFTHNKSDIQQLSIEDDIVITSTFAMWPATVDINSESLAKLNCKEVNTSTSLNDIENHT
ncbi:MAG TPA: hypothetical protein P5530_03565 [Candidatus Diapherotrites archaeon]|jgi:hypothetical protein|nr:hypothetical protein [Candidatus Diapherotrites archaeon]